MSIQWRLNHATYTSHLAKLKARRLCKADIEKIDPGESGNIVHRRLIFIQILRPALY